MEQDCFGHVSQIKEDLLVKVQVMDKKEAKQDLTDLDRSERNCIKEEFIEITAPWEIRWRQETRLKWLQEGDNNIKFFHSFVNARRTNNGISA